MSDYTAGPWEFRPAHGNDMGGIYSPSDRVCWFGNNTTYYPQEGEPPSAADARLIAAAPELLASLRGLLVLMTQAIASGDWRVDGACDPDAEVIRARIAIAKATGATP